MYNRYIPQHDGGYQKKRLPDNVPKPIAQSAPPPPPCPPEKTPPTKHAGVLDFFKGLLPSELDTGDLLIILMLLLMAGDNKESKHTPLLTLVLYLLM